MELRPGVQIDRYTLEHKLGEGGQGEVWRASDRFQPGKIVALKLVSLFGADASQLERVRREARNLARLNHPTLPSCHGLFEDLQFGLLVVVLELVEGPTLSAAASGLPDEPRKAILLQVAAALSFLHLSGVVHRDIKPDNVILTPEFAKNPSRAGSVKLIDLGISINRGNPQPLTVLGHIIGTSSYLAPEILDPHGFPASASLPAIDVFAFGVLAWQLLYGQHPTCLAESSSLEAYALAYRQAAQLPVWPLPTRGDVWEGLLRRCLAVRASERFPSGTELLAAVAGATGTSPPQPPLPAARGEGEPLTPAPSPPSWRGESWLPPASTHAPPPVSAHAPPPVSAHAPPPASAHAPPLASAHAPPLASAHAPPLASAHAPPLASAHAPPLASAHAPPLASAQASVAPHSAPQPFAPRGVAVPSAAPSAPVPTGVPSTPVLAAGPPAPGPRAAPLSGISGEGSGVRNGGNHSPLPPTRIAPAVGFEPPASARPAMTEMAAPLFTGAPAAATTAPMDGLPQEPPRPAAGKAPLPRAQAPLVAEPKGWAAPRQQGYAQQIEKPRVSVFRYLLAFFLLLFGGGIAFVLTLILFLLAHFGK